MKTNNNQLIFSAWLVAAIATAGSLFFSVVMDFVPCTLCWYQRIAMYPLAVILLIGFSQEDRKSITYALPFTIIGILLYLTMRNKNEKES